MKRLSFWGSRRSTVSNSLATDGDVLTPRTKGKLKRAHTIDVRCSAKSSLCSKMSSGKKASYTNTRSLSLTNEDDSRNCSKIYFLSIGDILTLTQQDPDFNGI